MTKNRAHKRSAKALAAKADVRHPDAFYLADTRKLRTPDWGVIDFAKGPLRLLGTESAFNHYRPLEVILQAAQAKRWRIVQLDFDTTRPLPDMLAYLRGKPTLTVIVTGQRPPSSPVINELLTGTHKDLNVVIQGQAPAQSGDHKVPGKVIFFGIEDGVDPEPIPPRITDWYSMIDQGGAVHGPVGGSPEDSPEVAYGAPAPTEFADDFAAAVNRAMREKPDVFILNDGNDDSLERVQLAPGVTGSGVNGALMRRFDEATFGTGTSASTNGDANPEAAIDLGSIEVAPGTLDPFALVEADGQGDEPTPDPILEAWSKRGIVVPKEISDWLTDGTPGSASGGDVSSAFVKAPLRAPELELFVGVTGDHSSMDTRKITGAITRASNETLAAADAAPFSLITGPPGTGRTAAGWARVNAADAVLNALGVPESAQEFATYPDGLFLITGTTGTGKTAAGLALMRRAQVDKGREAFAIMDSREALGPRLGSTTLIPVYGQRDYPAAIREAVERGARVMFVDGLYDPETIEAAVDASLSGVLVFATMHSRPEDALQRLQDDFQGEGASEIQERVQRAVRGVIGVQLIQGEGPRGRTLAAEVWTKDDNADEPALARVLTFEESRASLVAEGTIL